MPTRHAYLHGFASSSMSRKGQALRAFYVSRGRSFETPDLNHPSFAELTYTGMLEAISALDGPAAARSPDGDRWRFIASSMGGFAAARWAQLHPTRVDRLILLAPAFDFVERWPQLLGEQSYAHWREQGSTPLPDATGQLVQVHYGLVEDARQHPARPRVPCQTLIVHGIRDAVVPIESSRAYAQAHPDRVRLVEVDDDHLLVQSLATIEALAQEFLISPTHKLCWDHRGPSALETATHLLIHIDEFLAREGLEGCETGVEALVEGQHAQAWCRCPDELVERIGRALRPRRVE